MKRLIGVALLAAVLLMPVSPARAAVVGGGAGVACDSRSDRSLCGGASFTVTPIVNSNFVRVDFECHALAGPDASQTRIRPPWENGCVLYKNGTAIARTSALSVPGSGAWSSGSVETTPGDFDVCWSVAAAFLGDGGQELTNSGCTTVHF